MAPLYTKGVSSILSLNNKLLSRKHGETKVILYDIELEFIIAYFRSMLKRMKLYGGIDHLITITGLVERFSWTLVDKLKKITDFESMIDPLFTKGQGGLRVFLPSSYRLRAG